MNKKCITKKEAEELKEFSEFCICDCACEKPASAVQEKINAELNPTSSAVFVKTMIIYIIASALTLTVCPQFGIGPIGGGAGILGFVMKYGHFACGAFCGAFFLSGSALLTAIFMNRAQKRVVEKHYFGFFVPVALLLLTALIIISNIVNGSNPHLHPEFISAWILSGVLFSIAFFRVVSRLEAR